MSEYAGSAMALRFVNPAGTLVMGPETRFFSLSPSQAVTDITGSSDAVRAVVLGFTTYAPVWDGVAQTAAAGTAYAQQLKPGVSGTLFYSPAGNVSGGVEYTIPALVLDVESVSPYSDVTAYAASFGVLAGMTVTIGAVGVVGLAGRASMVFGGQATPRATALMVGTAGLVFGGTGTLDSGGGGALLEDGSGSWLLEDSTVMDWG